MKRWPFRAAAALMVWFIGWTGTATAQSGELNADALKGIAFRSIGPGLVTGRIADIEIDPTNTSMWYVATAFGGLWKTTNRGVTFTPHLRRRRRSRTSAASRSIRKNSNVALARHW